ncbi:MULTISPECIES: hypothetical protein [Blastococcus]|uniref:Uncharacterized protein n=2 Tax=Blastococcus TaxID=38501 RepID=A0A1I2G177_9ACTN|nr:MULTISPECIES: hypothetical protein [unclassified Blastococcus]WRL65517.1 hypothetical protein U6N30_07935 [Blastococcus sp. BMG 8361]SFF11424.1 hypothetical protein SAMN05216574_1093 [Blastococcus sp. DSM 46838]
MKISFDTEHDSFDSVIHAVQAAYGVSYSSNGDAPAAGGGEDDDYLPGKWTRPRLRKLVEWLADSDAAVAMRYIAEHAPAVDLDDVFEHMGAHTGIQDFDGKAMGGRMSAIGFARNAIGGGVTGPYDTDYNSRKYRMDKKVAEALLEEMDAYANA